MAGRVPKWLPGAALVVTVVAAGLVVWQVNDRSRRKGIAQGARKRAGEALMMSDYEAAKRHLGVALEATPEDADIRAQRATVLYVTGDFAGAIADCDEVIRQTGGTPATWHTRGVSKVMAGNLEGGCKDLEIALQKAPGDAGVMASRADAFKRLGKLEAALKDLDDSLRRDPSSDRVWRLRSEVRFLKADFAGSRDDASEAILRNQADPEGYYLRALAHRGLQDEEAAKKDAEKALEVAPPGWVRTADVKAWVETLSAPR